MSRPSHPRARRIDSNLRRILAEEIELLADPRLQLVTITGVETSPDMHKSIVYFSSMPLERMGEAKGALQAAAPRLRAAVGRQVRMKFTPELEFRPDTGVVEGEKIESLLRQLSEDDAEEAEQ
jgi:ribosome-binding factor A